MAEDQGPRGPEGPGPKLGTMFEGLTLSHDAWSSTGRKSLLSDLHRSQVAQREASG